MTFLASGLAWATCILPSSLSCVCMHGVCVHMSFPLGANDGDSEFHPSHWSGSSPSPVACTAQNHLRVLVYWEALGRWLAMVPVSHVSFSQVLLVRMW